MILRRFHYIRRLLTEHIDFPLLLIVLTLMCLGLATVYSATVETSSRLYSQLINFLIGLFVMWLVARCPPQQLIRFAPLLYFAGIILLLLVFPFGTTVNGAKRWLSLGFTRIQPSEIMKIATPLMLAWYFSGREDAPKWRHFFIAGILAIIPFALIAKQPDLGTAILVGAVACYVIFFAGLSWKLVLTLFTMTIAAAPFFKPLLYNYIIPLLQHDYQKKRVLTLLDPTSDPLGAGYHIIQSTIAIGSGGTSGKGWLAGTQTHLEFIPERHTDFIFAVFSEEHGFLGNCLLTSLYLLLIARGLMITLNAPTLFTRLLGGAISLSFFTYAFVNMGMVSGILPVVGVPLPFMSYGGTALVTLFIGIGILMSIQSHRTMTKSR